MPHSPSPHLQQVILVAGASGEAGLASSGAAGPSHRWCWPRCVTTAAIPPRAATWRELMQLHVRVAPVHKLGHALQRGPNACTSVRVCAMTLKGMAAGREESRHPFALCLVARQAKLKQISPCSGRKPSPTCRPQQLDVAVTILLQPQYQAAQPALCARACVWACHPSLRLGLHADAGRSCTARCMQPFLPQPPLPLGTGPAATTSQQHAGCRPHRSRRLRARRHHSPQPHARAHAVLQHQARKALRHVEQVLCGV